MFLILHIKKWLEWGSRSGTKSLEDDAYHWSQLPCTPVRCHPSSWVQTSSCRDLNPFVMIPITPFVALYPKLNSKDQYVTSVIFLTKLSTISYKDDNVKSNRCINSLESKSENHIFISLSSLYGNPLFSFSPWFSKAIFASELAADNWDYENSS